MSDAMIAELARLQGPSRVVDFSIFAYLSPGSSWESAYSGSDADDDPGEFGALDPDGQWHRIPAYTSDMDLAMSLFVTRPSNAMPNAWTACKAAIYQRRNAASGPAFDDEQLYTLTGRHLRGEATERKVVERAPMLLRVPPSLKEAVVNAAKAEGSTINEWMVACLWRGLPRKGTT